LNQGAWNCESATTKTPINHIVKKADIEITPIKKLKEQTASHEKNTDPVITKSSMNNLPIAVIYFDFDRFVLKPEAKISLLDSLTLIKDKSIEIHGYVDDIGDRNYNHKLGLNRANQVKDFYIKTGMPHSNIAVYGHADETVNRKTEEERSKDRKVSIYLSQ
jgi:outer membrane protein OmpA-like peptidoglycan-associated protein